MKKLILSLFLLVLTTALLPAQSYNINWYKVAGGGGMSGGGTYSLSGTIGQPDAGGPLTGGSYSLSGGFWSLISLVQTPGVPNLIIAHAGSTSVTVSWPATGSYTLQQSGNPAGGAWTTSGYTVSNANGTNSVTINPPNGNLFFRLTKP